jgi:hypothetical protein
MTEGFASIITLLERRRSAIEEALRALREIDGLAPTTRTVAVGPVATPEVPTGNRKKRSAAVRERMREAQKLRWAKIKGESEKSAAPTPEAPRAKRKISPEGLKRIVAATKKRWRLVKAKAAAEANAAMERAEARKAARKKAVAKGPAAKAATKVAPVKKSMAKKAAPVRKAAMTNSEPEIAELARTSLAQSAG